MKAIISAIPNIVETFNKYKKDAKHLLFQNDYFGTLFLQT